MSIRFINFVVLIILKMPRKFNIGDCVIFKRKKTYIKQILGVGKPKIYVLPRNKIALSSQLKKCKIKK